MSSFRLIAGIAALFAAGAVLQWLHPLAQPASYHQFADTRTLGPVPSAADVLSSLAYLIPAAMNLGWAARHAGRAPLVLHGITVAGAGFLLTTAGSAYYHWAPSDATLAWDRLPMTVVFAGVLVMLASAATLKRATWPQALTAAAAAAATVWYWSALGSLWPYALLQFGGVACAVWCAARGRVPAAAAWWRVIGWYALSKVFELLDTPIWALTGHLVSGHTLKHLASAAAGVALCRVANHTLHIEGKRSNG